MACTDHDHIIDFGVIKHSKMFHVEQMGIGMGWNREVGWS
jgi:hypothetical protein